MSRGMLQGASTPLMGHVTVHHNPLIANLR